MSVSRSEFESLVEEALAHLPKQFADLLDNVAIVVEEEPAEDDLEVMDDEAYEAGDELLGIYRGIALPRRTHDMLPTLPDQIAIFRGPILRVARSRNQIVREVRETVIHELGHYFGLSDEDMVY